jgi:nucleoside-triphosphatase
VSVTIRRSSGFLLLVSCFQVRDPKNQNPETFPPSLAPLCYFPENVSMHISNCNILLTGTPGCGKTTIIRKVVDGLTMPVKGFFTEEVRGSAGQRIGFDVVMLDGRRGPLARVGFSGPRVGKYGVCLDFLETVALEEISKTVCELVVVDEIGKMESYSAAFREVVSCILDGRTLLIGTVALGGSVFIREVRIRTDIELIEVTVRNRDGLAKKLIKRLRV